MHSLQTYVLKLRCNESVGELKKQLNTLRFEKSTFSCTGLLHVGQLAIMCRRSFYTWNSARSDTQLAQDSDAICTLLTLLKGQLQTLWRALCGCLALCNAQKSLDNMPLVVAHTYVCDCMHVCLIHAGPLEAVRLTS